MTVGSLQWNMKFILVITVSVLLVMMGIMTHRILKLEDELTQTRPVLTHLVHCMNSLVPWNNPNCINEARDVAKLLKDN